MLRDGNREREGANGEQRDPGKRMLEAVRDLGEQDLGEVERLLRWRGRMRCGTREHGKRKTGQGRARSAAAQKAPNTSLLNVISPLPVRRGLPAEHTTAENRKAGLLNS